MYARRDYDSRRFYLGVDPSQLGLPTAKWCYLVLQAVRVNDARMSQFMHAGKQAVDIICTYCTEDVLPWTCMHGQLDTEDTAVLFLVRVIAPKPTQSMKNVV